MRGKTHLEQKLTPRGLKKLFAIRLIDICHIYKISKKTSGAHEQNWIYCGIWGFHLHPLGKRNLRVLVCFLNISGFCWELIWFRFCCCCGSSPHASWTLSSSKSENCWKHQFDRQCFAPLLVGSTGWSLGKNTLLEKSKCQKCCWSQFFWHLLQLSWLSFRV